MNSQNILQIFFTLLVLLLMSSSLTAQYGQKWGGIQHLNYRNQTDIHYQDTFPPGGRVAFYNKDHAHALSFGYHLRWVGRKNSYQQIEAMMGTARSSSYSAWVSPAFATPIFSRGDIIAQKDWRIRYRRGKTQSWNEWIRFDQGWGFMMGRTRIDTTQFQPSGFDRRQKRFDISVSYYVGLNYQVTPSLNIGYSFALTSLNVGRNWYRSEDPRLKEREKSTSEGMFEIRVLEAVNRWSNIRISYVLKGAKPI